jgi:hypothetical protein
LSNFNFFKRCSTEFADSARYFGCGTLINTSKALQRFFVYKSAIYRLITNQANDRVYLLNVEFSVHDTVCHFVPIYNLVRQSLKGTVSRDFLFQVFFHESSSLKPLKITLGSFQFFLNWQRYSQVKVHNRYQHRRQIMGTILDC